VKIIEASHSGVALAGRTAVKVVVEGVGFLRVNDVRRFVWRKLDAIIIVDSAPVIVVKAGGEKRLLKARVMPDAPGAVVVAVSARRVARVKAPKPRAIVGAPRVPQLKLKIRNLVEGDET
jgi:hypothetical protein